MRKLQSKGFTIIELLIATVIFSLILLIISGAIIQFSRIYYKGVISSKTQETARSIVDEVSRAAQFGTTLDSPSDNPDDPTSGAFCLGDKRFRYVLKQIRAGADRILIADTSPASCEMSMVGTSDDDRELLGDEMQLLEFKVTGDSVTGRYDVTVTVAYGTDVDIATKTCPALNFGGQYCAVSTVKSTVTKRL